MKKKIEIPQIDELGIVWVNEKKTSQVSGFAVQTLRNWRSRRKGIPYSKVNRAVRYRLSDIIAFMELRRVEPSK